jgi:transcriptional regulator with XRE-family HTH domain
MKVFLGISGKELSEVMKKYRIKHKYTQSKIADYLGIDRTTYTKYENERKPEIDVIMKLAALYDVSVDEFLKDFFGEKTDCANPRAIVSAPLKKQNEMFELDEEEKQLLMLYRECIRKKEMLEKAKEIWCEDNKIVQE